MEKQLGLPGSRSILEGSGASPEPEQSITADPPPAFVRAIALHLEGLTEEARRFYRMVMDEGPAPARRASASNLARIEAATGHFAEAARLFRASLAVDPAQPDVLCHLGAVLLEMGDRAGAATPLREALALRPTNIAALDLLGRIDLAEGAPATALARFDAVLAARSTSAATIFNRGLALRALARHREAAEAFSRVTELQPSSPEAHNNRGRALHDTGDLAGAATAYEQALAIAPQLVPALLNAASLALERGRFGEAAQGFTDVLAIEPKNAGALAGLVHARQQACDWDGLAAQRADLLREIAAGAVVPPFLAIAAGMPDALQAACAAAWASSVAPRRRPKPPRRSVCGRPTRLGYLSGDFQDHATVHLISELIGRHDRRSFVIIGYSYGPGDGSTARARLVQAFDRFVDLAGLSDEDAADRIRADGIDLLIDLKGYTAHARPQILALRPAPIQVNWLGFPGTMGADFIDAVLADATTAPQSLQSLCTERILHLPDCFQPTDTTRVIGDALPRVAYGLPERGFVFCCFNNAYKITPQIFAIWMRLLHAVEDSVLWILADSTEACSNLAREAAMAGIDLARMVFAPRLPMADHLARHGAADLFLDTQPVNALTTASDALWAGLPVLTCLGETVSGRGGASLLRAAGLPELVAQDLDRYEALALDLASSPKRLTSIRRRLAAQRSTAPLFDTPRFVRHLEAALCGLLAGSCVAGAAPPQADSEQNGPLGRPATT